VNPTAPAIRTVHSTAVDIARNLSPDRDEIANTAAKIDEQGVAALAAHRGQTGRVFIAGAGRSGLVLRVAAMRLMHLGLTVHSTDGPAEQLWLRHANLE
jgi:6-phospho-3-hexuloisomerase